MAYFRCTRTSSTTIVPASSAGQLSDLNLLDSGGIGRDAVIKRGRLEPIPENELELDQDDDWGTPLLPNQAVVYNLNGGGAQQAQQQNDGGGPPTALLEQPLAMESHTLLEDPRLTLSNTWTLEVWIQPAVDPAESLQKQGGVFSFSLVKGTDFQVAYFHDAGFVFREFWSIPGGMIEQRFNPDLKIFSSSSWTHLALCYDGSSYPPAQPTLRLYVNPAGAAPPPSTSENKTIVGTSRCECRIDDGALIKQPLQWKLGSKHIKMTEIRLWDVLRSESDLVQNASGPLEACAEVERRDYHKKLTVRIKPVEEVVQEDEDLLEVALDLHTGGVGGGTVGRARGRGGGHRGAAVRADRAPGVVAHQSNFDRAFAEFGGFDDSSSAFVDSAQDQHAGSSPSSPALLRASAAAGGSAVDHQHPAFDEQDVDFGGFPPQHEPGSVSLDAFLAPTAVDDDDDARYPDDNEVYPPSEGDEAPGLLPSAGVDGAGEDEPGGPSTVSFVDSPNLATVLDRAADSPAGAYPDVVADIVDPVVEIKQGPPPPPETLFDEDEYEAGAKAWYYVLVPVDRYDVQSRPRRTGAPDAEPRSESEPEKEVMDNLRSSSGSGAVLAEEDDRLSSGGLGGRSDVAVGRGDAEEDEEDRPLTIGGRKDGEVFKLATIELPARRRFGFHWIFQLIMMRSFTDARASLANLRPLEEASTISEEEDQADARGENTGGKNVGGDHPSVTLGSSSSDVDGLVPGRRNKLNVQAPNPTAEAQAVAFSWRLRMNFFRICRVLELFLQTLTDLAQQKTSTWSTALGRSVGSKNRTKHAAYSTAVQHEWRMQTARDLCLMLCHLGEQLPAPHNLDVWYFALEFFLGPVDGDRGVARLVITRIREWLSLLPTTVYTLQKPRKLPPRSEVGGGPSEIQSLAPVIFETEEHPRRRPPPLQTPDRTPEAGVARMRRAAGSSALESQSSIDEFVFGTVLVEDDHDGSVGSSGGDRGSRFSSGDHSDSAIPRSQRHRDHSIAESSTVRFDHTIDYFAPRNMAEAQHGMSPGAAPRNSTTRRNSTNSNSVLRDEDLVEDSFHSRRRDEDMTPEDDIQPRILLSSSGEEQHRTSRGHHHHKSNAASAFSSTGVRAGAAEADRESRLLPSAPVKSPLPPSSVSVALNSSADFSASVDEESSQQL